MHTFTIRFSPVRSGSIKNDKTAAVVANVLEQITYLTPEMISRNALNELVETGMITPVDRGNIVFVHVITPPEANPLHSLVKRMNDGLPSGIQVYRVKLLESEDNANGQRMATLIRYTLDEAIENHYLNPPNKMAKRHKANIERVQVTEENKALVQANLQICDAILEYNKNYSKKLSLYREYFDWVVTINRDKWVNALEPVKAFFGDQDPITASTATVWRRIKPHNKGARIEWVLSGGDQPFEAIQLHINIVNEPVPENEQVKAEIKNQTAVINLYVHEGESSGKQE